jgi:hypothetical protein
MTDTESRDTEPPEPFEAGALEGVAPVFAPEPPKPARRRLTPETLTFIIRRADLVARGCCVEGLLEHDRRAAAQGGGPDTVFLGGWTEELAREIYARPGVEVSGPEQLEWLELQGFVPRTSWPERQLDRAKRARARAARRGV